MINQDFQKTQPKAIIATNKINNDSSNFIFYPVPIQLTPL